MRGLFPMRLPVTIGLLCLASAVWAKPRCDRALQEADALDQYWALSQSKPFQSGASPTYAYDFEIGFGDFYRVLSNSPQAKKWLDETWAGERFSKDKLVRKTGMSEAQIDRFVLRAGVPRDQGTYSVSDIHPGYLDHLEIRFFQSKDESESRAAMIGRLMREQGYPFADPIYETPTVIEFAHERYEKVPSEYSIQIDRIYSEFRRLNLHGRVGLPAADVSDEQLLAIGRALETQMVLSLAANGNRNVLPYVESMLTSSDTLWALRGIVRVISRRWSSPVEMHDIEIRQYDDPEHLKRLLALATRLGESVAKLRIPTPQEHRLPAKKKEDPYAQNLEGALRYAAALLSASSGMQARVIADELRTFADRIRSEPRISEATRVQIEKYLNRHRITEMLWDERLYVN